VILGLTSFSSADAFAAELGMHQAEPGHVASRATEADRDAARHGIADERHHDRDRARLLTGRLDGRRRCRHDDIDLSPRQLRGKRGQPFEAAVRPALLDDEVVSLDVADFAQTLAKRLGERPSDRR
jgi:hypothetical protein